MIRAIERIASSAREGLRLGVKYYWRDTSCKFGHIPLFYVTSMNCVTCTNERANAAHKKHRARINFNHRLWYRDNVAKVSAKVRKRQLAKLQRNPAWADLAAIEAFYAACPAGHHVDHEIPLQGRLVSGLHVLNNLRYLPEAENLAKGNKFNPWTFEA